MNHSFDFHLAVHQVCSRDERYAPEGYAFLCTALQHAVKMHHREEEEDKHVTGPQLLIGFRDYALQEFGPLALFVMHEWGIRASEDVGNMVYNFIEVKYFGRNDTDRLEDFSDGVALDEALTRPYQRASR